MTGDPSTSSTCLRRQTPGNAVVLHAAVQIKVEYRLYSFISMNRRGRPLVSYRRIIELISATTTTTGLTIQAEEDLNFYQAGTKVGDADLKVVPLMRHKFHGDWNYTVAQSNSRRALTDELPGGCASEPLGKTCWLPAEPGERDKG